MKKRDEKPVLTNTEKSMILRLSLDEHDWVKTIAAATEMPQPKVVNLILGEAMKHDPDTYINQVKKEHAKRVKAQLEQEIRQKQEQLKQLESID